MDASAPRWTIAACIKYLNDNAPLIAVLIALYSINTSNTPQVVIENDCQPDWVAQSPAVSLDESSTQNWDDHGDGGAAEEQFDARLSVAIEAELQEPTSAAGPCEPVAKALMTLLCCIVPCDCTPDN